MSYGELAILTDTIAGQLQRAGFGRDSRIAVVHRGGAEGLAVVLGVVKRSIAVSISNEYSANEFGSHFGACGVEAVIVDASLDTPARDVARARGLRVVDFERGQDGDAAGQVTLDLGSPPHHSLAAPARADDIAFVFGTNLLGPIRERKLNLNQPLVLSPLSTPILRQFRPQRSAKQVERSAPSHWPDRGCRPACFSVARALVEDIDEQSVVSSRVVSGAVSTVP
jgi:hypothetical protein